MIISHCSDIDAVHCYTLKAYDSMADNSTHDRSPRRKPHYWIAVEGKDIWNRWALYGNKSLADVRQCITEHQEIYSNDHQIKIINHQVNDIRISKENPDIWKSLPTKPLSSEETQRILENIKNIALTINLYLAVSVNT